MIRLTEPDIGIEELIEVGKVLKSGYLVQGQMIQKLEKEVREYLGVKNAIAVSNGTAALHLSLIALGIGPGDEVIIPDLTFPATANVVELVGASPVLIDICLNTFNIDVSKLEAKITDKTKAIIPVHEFGQAANMNAIMEIKKKYGLKVIEDAACAIGCKYQEQFIGTIGDIGCFSFHPRKAITTGEGGIIVTSSNTISERLRVLRNHGIENRDGIIDFVVPGFNYRLTDIQGAIGCVQVKKLEKIIIRRLELAEIYSKGFEENRNLSVPLFSTDRSHIYQTYYVIVNEKVDRDELMQELRDDNIECNYGAYSIHGLSYYKNKYSLDPRNYQNSIRASQKGIALPLHSRMSNEDVKYIIDRVNIHTKCI